MSLIARWQLRRQLRTLYPEIVAAMIQWIIDTAQADIEQFVAGGHAGLFGKIPDDDLAVRLARNGYTSEEIADAILREEAPVNWMTKEEEEAVIERIELMKEWFSATSSGVFKDAVEMYNTLGRSVRDDFYQRFNYYPEQSLTPYVRITGTESEKKKLKPDSYQPPLL